MSRSRLWHCILLNSTQRYLDYWRHPLSIIQFRPSCTESTVGGDRRSTWFPTNRRNWAWTRKRAKQFASVNDPRNWRWTRIWKNDGLLTCFIYASKLKAAAIVNFSCFSWLNVPISDHVTLICVTGDNYLTSWFVYSLPVRFKGEIILCKSKPHFEGNEAIV